MTVPDDTALSDSACANNITTDVAEAATADTPDLVSATDASPVVGTDPAPDARADSEAGTESSPHSPFEGWTKKTLLGKLDAVALDYWNGGPVCWWTAMVLSCVAGVCTRLHGVSQPYAVVWDETHFGKMASWYINGTYFFDVHPPGGKLLLAMLGWLGGYNGSHPFTAPGLSYEGHDGILFMRASCALMGAALAPLAFASVWTATGRLPPASLATILVLADLGSLTLTKFILLDAPLLFFVMASFFSLACLHRSTLLQGEFSRAWWASLAATGLCLGCVVSVKFVGLFTVGLVALFSAAQLWDLLARASLRELVLHITARAVCLGGVPVAMYLAFFLLHDSRLYRTFSSLGSEEAALSPEYQMTLQGNILHSANFSPQVVYGGLISLRNSGLAGPYLHSHNLTFPRQPRLQQVTGYRAKDHNNYFRILHPLDDPDAAGQVYSDGPEGVRDGDYVRLYHVLTNATVAAAGQGAFVTGKHKLVYAEAYSLQPPLPPQPLHLLDTPDLPEPPSSHVWQVVMAPLVQHSALHTPPGEERSSLSPLVSQFSLLNIKFGCFLTWSHQKLPQQWAEGQEEVTCSKNGKAGEALWRIETNFNPYDNFSVRASSLVQPLDVWGRLLETHQLMRWTNANLKPDASDRSSPFYHRPWMWPIVYKSQPWYDVNFRIVLLGNPPVMWLCSAGVAAAAFLLVHRDYCRRRGLCSQSVEDQTLEFWCKWLLVGYLLHYLPFFGMTRVLYYHHYFPALQFSSLLTGVLLGHLLQKTSPRICLLSTASVALCICFTFVAYCEVGYGYPTSEAFNPNTSRHRHVRWRDEWHI